MIQLSNPLLKAAPSLNKAANPPVPYRRMSQWLPPNIHTIFLPSAPACTALTLADDHVCTYTTHAIGNHNIAPLLDLKPDKTIRTKKVNLQLF